MMPDINRLREKASALGFSFQRGSKKGAGYVLVNDANGDKPLGDTYTASLADVERYLDSFADDAGIDEVEIGSGEPSKPPPTQAEMRKSLQGHPNAGAIKGVLQPQSETRDEQRQRIGLDHLVLSRVTLAQWAAFDRLPEEEKQAYFAKVKAAKAAEEKRKADKAPKPKINLRDFDNSQNETSPSFDELADHLADEARDRRIYEDRNEDPDVQAKLRYLQKLGPKKKISVDDPAFAEKVRANNVHWKADRQLYGYGGGKSFDEAGCPPPDPEAPNWLQVKPVSGVASTIKKSWVPKADIENNRELAKLKTRILDALAQNDRAAAGKMLIEAKKRLDHGRFQDWVKEELNLHPKAMQRYIKDATA